LRSHADAEDVVQEVSQNVLRALPNYVPKRPFEHWLQVIARNACLVRLRQRRSERRRLELLRLEPRFEDREISFDPILRASLVRLLDGLCPRTRDALVMHLIEERSYAEIAERLEMGESAVKMRVARARRSLRERYTQQAAN